MSKRPLMVFTIAFTAGIIIGAHMSIWILISLFLLVALLYFIFTINRLTLYFSYTILAIAIVLGACSSFYTISKFNKTNLEKLSGTEIAFRAKIISEPEISDKKNSYLIMPLEVNGKNIRNTKMLLSIYQTDNSSPLFLYGHIITGAGKVVLPSHARNPGGFDYKRYLNSQGVYASIICFSGSVTDTGATDANLIIKGSLSLKDGIEKIIDQSLPQNQAGLLKGMLIGDRNGLPESIKNDFNISGLAHIICVSGANIAYIAFASIFILALVGIKKPYSSVITILVIITFMFITGCSPSVVRASIMGIMILLAEVFLRKPDVYTSISSACLLILLYNPLTLYDVGFQLSFAGTIGIILFYNTIFKIFKFLPKLLNEALSATFAAQITVCPIIAIYFNKVSLIALFSNILAIPATGLITFLGFITVLIGQISITIARIISSLNFVLLSFVLWIAEISANIPYASIFVPTPGITFLIIFYGVSFTLLWYFPRRKKENKFFAYIPALCLITALISILLMLMPKAFTISFLDVGQGDCLYIKNTSGQTCLIDGGGTYPGSFSSFKPENTVIPFLLDNGTASLDLAILSHPHGDHIQGLIKVAENLPIKRLIIGPQHQSNYDLDKLLEICRKKNTQIIEIKQGSRILFGDAEFIVLHPTSKGTTYQDSYPNNNSLVLKLNYKNIKILFTGDIQSEAESEILGSGQDIDVDILKISHHGSPYSTTLDFLKRTSPSSAIISVGRNSFGHPADSVLRRLEQNHVQVFRTDKNGCITVEIDDKGYSITPTLTE